MRTTTTWLLALVFLNGCNLIAARHSKSHFSRRKWNLPAVVRSEHQGSVAEFVSILPRGGYSYNGGEDYNSGYDDRGYSYSQNDNYYNDDNNNNMYEDDGRYSDDDRGYYDDRGSAPVQRGRPAFSMPKIIKSGNRKIGLPLLAAGAALTVVGVSLFFNKTLMRLGNLFFVAGVPMTIGPGRTASYFLQPKKARATGCLFLGIFLVFVGHPVLGILLEAFGFLNLFGNMFPVAFAVLKTMPGIGPLLKRGSGSSKRDRYDDERYYDDDDDGYGGGGGRYGDDDRYDDNNRDSYYDDRNYYDNDDDRGYY